MIWSLTYRNSKHINIEKDAASCKMHLHKIKFTNFYQVDQAC